MKKTTIGWILLMVGLILVSLNMWELILLNKYIRLILSMVGGAYFMAMGIKRLPKKYFKWI